MLVAHVLLAARPGRRDVILSVLVAAAPQVRARDGCALFAPLSDPEDPGRVLIVHEWKEESAFASYLASEPFAALGRALAPDLAGPPESRRFGAEPLEAGR